MATETVGPAGRPRDQGTASSDPRSSAPTASASQAGAGPAKADRPGDAAAGDVTVRAKQQAGRFARETRERARAYATRQKSRTAERLGGVAMALHDTARNLENEGDDGTAQYVQRAGDGVDWLSSELRDRDLDSLVGATEEFARQRPAAFLGGAVAAGFLLARFLKSTATAEDGGAPAVSSGHRPTAIADSAADARPGSDS